MSDCVGMCIYERPEFMITRMCDRCDDCVGVDTDETPQLRLPPLTDDLCGKETCVATVGSKRERAKHTAETPQLSLRECVPPSGKKRPDAIAFCEGGLALDEQSDDL